MTTVRNFCILALAVLLTHYFASKGLTFAAGILWLPVGFLLDIDGKA